MWRLRLRKVVKFGHGAIVGGFVTSIATSLYEIIVVIARARGQSYLLFGNNC